MATLFEGASMQAYRENLGTHPPLDRETERQLARKWRGGDAQAGRRIVEACLPFVITIALEYRRWGVPLEDIVQQGNMGLLKAARKFNPDRDCRLATYAAYWIRAEIRDYVVRTYRIVRLGTTKGERRALRAYRLTRESDPSKLAEISGLTPAKAEALLPLLAGREASLDATPPGGSPMLQGIAAVGPSPEDEAGANESRSRAAHAVREALEDLTDRERCIVQERLMNDEPTTLQALGTRLGVSKERVRQIEERLRSKLRDRLEDFRESA